MDEVKYEACLDITVKCVCGKHSLSVVRQDVSSYYNKPTIVLVVEPCRGGCSKYFGIVREGE